MGGGSGAGGFTGASERCCGHTAYVLGPCQDQCAGLRVPVLGRISITTTLSCVTLGNAFLPICYPSEILLPSYFFPVLTALC